MGLLMPPTTDKRQQRKMSGIEAGAEVASTFAGVRMVAVMVDGEATRPEGLTNAVAT